MDEAVRRATSADVEHLSRTLADAFREDPVWTWILRNRRPERLERFFALELRHVGIARGSVWTTPDRNGGAIVMPPGQWRVPIVAQARSAPAYLRVFGSGLARALWLLSRVEARHPDFEHMYFPYIGVAAAAQGRGFGSALMAPGLRECDARGLPAYLEASNARCAALYRRLGFESVDEFDYGGSEPIRFMTRIPR